MGPTVCPLLRQPIRIHARRTKKARWRSADSRSLCICVRAGLFTVKARIRSGSTNYHRWAADPGATVTTAFTESFRSANAFSAVAPYDGQNRSDYLITGRPERLDETDHGGGVRVEAKLSAVLMNLRAGSIVCSGDAEESSNVDKHDMNWW